MQTNYSFNISQSKLVYGLIFILYFTLNFQTLTIKGFQTENIFFIKIYHISAFILLFFLFNFKYLKIKILGGAVYLFFLYILLLSIFCYALLKNFNSLILNYSFAFILFIASTQLGFLDDKRVLKVLRYAILSIIALIIIKNILYIDEIIKFLRMPYGHPVIPWIYGGKANLEATWIALNCALFISKRNTFYLLILISIALSIIYASRIGFILNVVVLFFRFISPYSSPREVKKILLIVIVLMLSIAIIFKDEIMNGLYLFSRFISIGSDAGSVGRLSMWEGIPGAISKNPFGYGAGNSAHAIQPFVSRTIAEDNIHNYYIQNFIEFGLIGGLGYFLIVFLFLKKKGPIIFKYLIYCYLVGAMVQFRGAEPIFWFIFGLNFAKWGAKSQF